MPPPVPACHGFADATLMGAASTSAKSERLRRKVMARFIISAVLFTFLSKVYEGEDEEESCVAWFCLLRVGRSGGVWGTGRIRHGSRDGFRFGSARACSVMGKFGNAVSSICVFAITNAQFCIPVFSIHTYSLIVHGDRRRAACGLSEVISKRRLLAITLRSLYRWA
jgi:hypothetical protein